MAKFWAAEPHVCGTKLYEVGDEREADELDVKHLVDLKVLSTKKVAKPKMAATEIKPEGSEPETPAA